MAALIVPTRRKNERRSRLDALVEHVTTFSVVRSMSSRSSTAPETRPNPPP
ncbi:MAG: hypothetical protein U0414_39325 [Polyangiaceae bacterium]